MGTADEPRPTTGTHGIAGRARHSWADENAMDESTHVYSAADKAFVKEINAQRDVELIPQLAAANNTVVRDSDEEELAEGFYDALNSESVPVSRPTLPTIVTASAIAERFAQMDKDRNAFEAQMLKRQQESVRCTRHAASRGRCHLFADSKQVRKHGKTTCARVVRPLKLG